MKFSYPVPFFRLLELVTICLVRVPARVIMQEGAHFGNVRGAFWQTRKYLPAKIFIPKTTPILAPLIYIKR